MDTETLLEIVLVVHVLTAILMARPFYALVAVNNRARLGPPLGDRADVLLEGTVKNRRLPCFGFQATALLSGLALIVLHGYGLDVLLSNPALLLKLLSLVGIAGLLGYVALAIQPRIDALFAVGAPEARGRESASSSSRSLATLGLQAWQPLPLWLTGVLLAAIALFSWRAYKTVTPYGWL